MKLIRKIIVLAILLKGTIAQAQYREMFSKYPYEFFQQPDSLYKVNKVKKRISYSSSVNSNLLLHEFSMDTQGRIKSIMYPPFMSVLTRYTQFTYNASGKIAAVQDVFVKGKDNKFYQELISNDKDLEKKYKAMPAKVVYDYTISNPADTTKVVTRTNEKGDTISQSVYTKNGLAQNYKEFGQYGSDATILYMNHPSFEHQPVSFAYKSLGQPYLSTYEYLFDEQNHISKMIKRSYSGSKDPYNTDFYILEYDKNGLLLKVKVIM